MTEKPALALFVAAAIAAALSLSACGGGSDGSTSSTAVMTSEAPHQSRSADAGRGSDEHPGGQGEDGQSRAGGKGQGAPGGTEEGLRHVPVSPLEVSGGGSAQFHVKGGDNSVQDYGEEAGESELRQAAEATHSLLVASVRGEWAQACALLAATERQRLELAVAAQSPQRRGKGCAAALAAFTQPVPGSLAREITQVDAVSLRHEGEQAFLIYVGAPEKTVYAMPLRLEGGAWKPTAIAGVTLPGVR